MGYIEEKRARLAANKAAGKPELTVRLIKFRDAGWLWEVRTGTGLLDLVAYGSRDTREDASADAEWARSVVERCGIGAGLSIAAVDKYRLKRMEQNLVESLANREAAR